MQKSINSLLDQVGCKNRMILRQANGGRDGWVHAGFNLNDAGFNLNDAGFNLKDAGFNLKDAGFN